MSLNSGPSGPVDSPVYALAALRTGVCRLTMPYKFAGVSSCYHMLGPGRVFPANHAVATSLERQIRRLCCIDKEKQ